MEKLTNEETIALETMLVKFLNHYEEHRTTYKKWTPEQIAKTFIHNWKPTAVLAVTAKDNLLPTLEEMFLECSYCLHDIMRNPANAESHKRVEKYLKKYNKWSEPKLSNKNNYPSDNDISNWAQKSLSETNTDWNNKTPLFCLIEGAKWMRNFVLAVIPFEEK